MAPDACGIVRAVKSISRWYRRRLKFLTPCRWARGFRDLLILGQALEIVLKLHIPVVGQSMSSKAELMKMSGSRITHHLVATFMAGVFGSPLMAYPLVPAECRGREVECAQKQELSYISVFGKITEEDLAFFEKLDAELPPDMPLPRVFLNSAGGYVDAAIGIGKILRKRGSTVETGSPLVEDIRPQCSSACVIIAAGAVKRRLTHIGLHSSKVRVKLAENVFEDQHAETPEVEEFYAEMGIPVKVSEIRKKIPFDSLQNIFLDPSLRAEAQGISKLGFFMSDVPSALGDTAIPVPEPKFLYELDYLEHAVQHGSREALADLVDYYQRYDPNVPPDFEKAVFWLRKGAELGEPWAMHNLGYYYAYGIGVPADASIATSWYLKAAGLGEASSQNNLGWRYYEGEGVPQSLPDAIFWITRSAEQGEPFAYGSLCEIQDETTFLQDNQAEAFKWCQLALDYMPTGDARAASEAAMARLEKALTNDERAAGERLVEMWQPLRQTSSQMKNVGDDLN